MNRVRKTFLLITGCLFLACASLFAAACTTEEPQTYKLQYAYTATEGSITATAPSGGGKEYAAGESVTITVTANNGYEVESVKVNGTSVTLDEAGKYTFQIESDTTVSATFKTVAAAESYSLTLSFAKAEGSVKATAPSGGGTKYAAGESVTITVTANNGYEVESVKVNGTPVTLGEEGKYTFEIEFDTTVAATFKTIVADDGVVPASRRGTYLSLMAGAGISLTLDADTAEFIGLTFTVEEEEENVYTLTSTDPDGDAYTVTFVSYEGLSDLILYIDMGQPCYCAKEGAELPSAELPASLDGTQWETEDKSDSLTIDEGVMNWASMAGATLRLLTFDGTKGVLLVTEAGMLFEVELTGSADACTGITFSNEVLGANYQFVPKTSPSVSFAEEWRGHWSSSSGHNADVAENSFTYTEFVDGVLWDVSAGSDNTYTATVDDTSKTIGLISAGKASLLWIETVKRGVTTIEYMYKSDFEACSAALADDLKAQEFQAADDPDRFSIDAAGAVKLGADKAEWIVYTATGADFTGVLFVKKSAVYSVSYSAEKKTVTLTPWRSTAGKEYTLFVNNYTFAEEFRGEWIQPWNKTTSGKTSLSIAEKVLTYDYSGTPHTYTVDCEIIDGVYSFTMDGSRYQLSMKTKDILQFVQNNATRYYVKEGFTPPTVTGEFCGTSWTNTVGITTRKLQIAADGSVTIDPGAATDYEGMWLTFDPQTNEGLFGAGANCYEFKYASGTLTVQWLGNGAPWIFTKDATRQPLSSFSAPFLGHWKGTGASGAEWEVEITENSFSFHQGETSHTLADLTIYAGEGTLEFTVGDTAYTFTVESDGSLKIAAGTASYTLPSAAETPSVPWKGKGTNADPYLIENIFDTYTILLEDDGDGYFAYVYFTYTPLQDTAIKIDTGYDAFYLKISATGAANWIWRSNVNSTTLVAGKEYKFMVGDGTNEYAPGTTVTFTISKSPVNVPAELEDTWSELNAKDNAKKVEIEGSSITVNGVVYTYYGDKSDTSSGYTLTASSADGYEITLVYSSDEDHITVADNNGFATYERYLAPIPEGFQWDWSDGAGHALSITEKSVTYNGDPVKYTATEDSVTFTSGKSTFTLTLHATVRNLLIMKQGISFTYYLVGEAKYTAVAVDPSFTGTFEADPTNDQCKTGSFTIEANGNVDWKVDGEKSGIVIAVDENNVVVYFQSDKTVKVLAYNAKRSEYSFDNQFFVKKTAAGGGGDTEEDPEIPWSGSGTKDSPWVLTSLENDYAVKIGLSAPPLRGRI